MKQLRKLHRYIGIFFAPTFLMFAASGYYQLNDWHRPKKMAVASSFSVSPLFAAWPMNGVTPQRLISLVTFGQAHTMVQMHMRPAGGSIWDVYSGASSKQITARLDCYRELAPLSEEKQGELNICMMKKVGAEAEREAPKNQKFPGSTALYYFMLLSCPALAVSTISGVVMGFRMSRDKWKPAATFIAGIIVPILLLYF